MSSRAPAPASRETPLVLVDEQNVRGLPLSYGLVVPKITLGGTGLALPLRFEVPEGQDPTIVVIDERGNTQQAPLTSIPGMQPFTGTRPNAPPVSMVTFHHRKRMVPETYLRILGIVGPDDPQGFASTEFYVGEHGDYPGEQGFYFRTVHLGAISLAHLDPTLPPPAPEYLPREQVAAKFFPIPPEYPFAA